MSQIRQDLPFHLGTYFVALRAFTSQEIITKQQDGGPKQCDILKFSKWIHVLKMQLVHRKQSVSAWGR